MNLCQSNNLNRKRSDVSKWYQCSLQHAWKQLGPIPILKPPALINNNPAWQQPRWLGVYPTAPWILLSQRSTNCALKIDTPCLLWWIHALMKSGQDVRSKIYHTKLYCLSIYSPKLSVWPTSNFSISPVDDLTMAGWPSGALLLSNWAVGICVVQEHWIWSLLLMKQMMTPIWEGLVE